MRLIVGLGNPGSRYTYTWHNCGFLAIEVLAQRHKLVLNKTKFQGEYTQGSIKGEKVMLLRPHTYMNLSGESIREAAAFFKIPPADVLVIYDDIDLPMGSLRFRSSGGPGTHNGMKSIISCLGTQDFPRLRIGCGPVPKEWDLADYVLSEIPKDRQEEMFSIFVQAAERAEAWLEESL